MRAAFERYSKDYQASIAHPLRSLMESNGDNEFLRAKARWVARWWADSNRPAPRVLDYGCGTGLLTKYLHDLRPDWNYSGADPSGGMIEKAKANAPFADFSVLPGVGSPYAGLRFDLVLMSGVLHHIPWQEWDWTFARVRSLLETQGRFLVFEHNPLNPLTQFVVRTTPIDRDARMRTSGFVMAALSRCGFEVESRQYLHFFPPRFQSLQSLERKIAWLPLGSQYLVWSRLM
jgi:SAM-dependent methyltransferase